MKHVITFTVELTIDSTDLPNSEIDSIALGTLKAIKMECYNHGITSIDFDGNVERVLVLSNETGSEFSAMV